MPNHQEDKENQTADIITDIENFFKDPGQRQEIREIMVTFCPEGQKKVLKILTEAEKKNLLSQFPSVLKQFDNDYFRHDPPGKRGDPSSTVNVVVYAGMIRELL